MSKCSRCHRNERDGDDGLCEDCRIQVWLETLPSTELMKVIIWAAGELMSKHGAADMARVGALNHRVWVTRTPNTSTLLDAAYEATRRAMGMDAHVHIKSELKRGEKADPAAEG